MTDVVAITAAVATAGAAAVAAWQLRHVARQSEENNLLTGTTELRAMHEHLHEVLGRLLDYPNLRQYIYEGVDATSLNDDDRSRLQTIVEMLADVLEIGLVTTEKHPSTDSLADWQKYVKSMLISSPTLKKLVAQHNDWWPKMAPFATAQP